MTHDGTILGMEREIERLRAIVVELTDALDLALANGFGHTPECLNHCEPGCDPAGCGRDAGWALVNRVRGEVKL